MFTKDKNIVPSEKGRKRKISSMRTEATYILLSVESSTPGINFGT